MNTFRLVLARRRPLPEEDGELAKTLALEVRLALEDQLGARLEVTRREVPESGCMSLALRSPTCKSAFAARWGVLVSIREIDEQVGVDATAMLFSGGRRLCPLPTGNGPPLVIQFMLSSVIDAWNGVWAVDADGEYEQFETIEDLR